MARGGGRRSRRGERGDLLAANGAPSARVEPSGHTALHGLPGGHVAAAAAAQLLAAVPRRRQYRDGTGPHAPNGLPRDDARRRLARRGDGPAPGRAAAPIRMRRRPTEAAGVLANAAPREPPAGRYALCRALCEGYDVAAQVGYKTRGQGHTALPRGLRPRPRALLTSRAGRVRCVV